MAPKTDAKLMDSFPANGFGTKYQKKFGFL